MGFVMASLLYPMIPKTFRRTKQEELLRFRTLVGIGNEMRKTDLERFIR